MWTSSASSCDPSLPPPPHPHYQLHTLTCHNSMSICERRLHPAVTPLSLPHPPLTCYDSTRTCEHRRCSAVTPLSLPHPTPTTSFTHPPVKTAQGHVNIVSVQLRPLSPSPTPPPLPASHTHLSWQHEDMWTSSASSCTRVALAWSTKRGWGPGLPRASWLHTPASSNVASRKCFCLQTAHRTDLGDGVLLICLIFSVFYLLLVVVVLCGFWGGCLFSYMYVIPLPHLP